MLVPQGFDEFESDGENMKYRIPEVHSFTVKTNTSVVISFKMLYTCINSRNTEIYRCYQT